MLIVFPIHMGLGLSPTFWTREHPVYFADCSLESAEFASAQIFWFGNRIPKRIDPSGNGSRRTELGFDHFSPIGIRMFRHSASVCKCYIGRVCSRGLVLDHTTSHAMLCIVSMRPKLFATFDTACMDSDHVQSFPSMTSSMFGSLESRVVPI